MRLGQRRKLLEAFLLSYKSYGSSGTSRDLDRRVSKPEISGEFLTLGVRLSKEKKRPNVRVAHHAFCFSEPLEEERQQANVSSAQLSWPKSENKNSS